ncbi:signal transduction histidine kinase [Variovorax paradoxus]|uniref:sensor histidine kinase n=1 Tax=Variovorax paradoxus TaxID=34073 RepID=UPI00278EA56E|nr:histidine kinase [Variovorax paradoxus]MDQ0571618.1 signal transduction histidine kinase [Variovorax paradoxus]
MPATSFDPDCGTDSNLTADAVMVARMRLVLAISALLAIAVDAGEAQQHIGSPVWLAFAGYLVYSVGVYICTRMGQPYFQGKAIHWFDVLWFTLLTFVTGGVSSLYFLFYFFVILTSSFRWGYEEGARVTMASVASFVACSLGTGTGTDTYTPQLLMRTTFLLALGHMIGHWGGSKVELRRRLALLSQVSRLSNPRFGVNRTIAGMMQKTLAFFEASHCILLTRDTATSTWVMRTLRKSHAGESVSVETIGRASESPLTALEAERIVLNKRRPWPLNWLRAPSQACDPRTHHWLPLDEHGMHDSAAVGAMLEARSFMSAPLPMRLGEGRIYMSSQDGSFRRSDALFLAHIMGQVFPVIETIEVLDRMASDAASKERLKISLDLHDTAIQPYIGLKLGLSALRKKATADNPLIDDLENLANMAEGVVADLRRYAGSVKHGADNQCEFILPHLHRQAARIKTLYGIDIAILLEGNVHLDDRMTAEVLQLVREGLNNICKHTHAHRGCIRIGCTDGKLQIQIENEASDEKFAAFRPRSISERAAALGGRAQVSQGADGATAVLVEIPI